MSTAFRPGRGAIRGAAPEALDAVAFGRIVKSMWAASVVAMPPTSRPPMALGWPVIENGAAPGLPMRPVARWTLRIAEPLAMPWADWLAPWRTGVTVRGVCGEQLEERLEIGRRQPAVGGDGGERLVDARQIGQRPRRSPRHGRPDRSRSTAPRAHQSASRPFHSRTSVCGRQRQVQVGRLGGFGAARIDDDMALAARAARPPCAGTAPDGTRRCWSRPARSGRRRRDPRSCRAPRPRRTRGVCAATAEAMHSRELVSILPEPMKPFISLLAT